MAKYRLGCNAVNISLPYEAHGYRGKENLLHMLYEQNAWLEKYVKHADKNRVAGADKKGF